MKSNLLLTILIGFMIFLTAGCAEQQHFTMKDIDNLTNSYISLNFYIKRNQKLLVREWNNKKGKNLEIDKIVTPQQEYFTEGIEYVVKERSNK